VGEFYADLEEHGARCYTLCTDQGDQVCGAGERCERYSSGNAYCVPGAPDPDPDPEPACQAGEVLTRLSYVDDPVCLRACDPSSAGSTCGQDATCIEVTGAADGVCAPDAGVVSTQQLSPTGGAYSVAADDLGRLPVVYGDSYGATLNGLLGTSAGVFGAPALITEDFDDGNVDNAIGHMKAATGPGGRIGLTWYVSSQAGFVPNAYFGMTKYWAQFGPGADNGTFDFYELYGRSESDFAENFDVSFSGTQMVVGANNPRAEQLEYGTPDARYDVWTPVRDIADLTLTHDPSGGGHMVYADGFNGFVYQYLPAVSGGGVIGDTRVLAAQDTQDPAGLDAAMAPSGVLGVHMTYWSNPDSEFCTGQAATPGGELTAWNCVDLTGLFGADPLDNAVAYSPVLGWVVCGGTTRGLECVGLSDSDRNLPQTLITSQPRRESNTGWGAPRSYVQAVATPDGAVHVFWISDGDARWLNHALIR